MESVVSFPLNGFITRCRNENNRLLKERSIGSLISSSLINLDDLTQIGFNNELTEHVIRQAISSIQANSAQVYTKFRNTNGANVKINWVQNHSTLVEFVRETLSPNIKALIEPSEGCDGLATIMVDVSMFLKQNKAEISPDMASVLYELGFLRAFAAFLNFSNKDAFEIALSGLRDGQMRLKLAEYLDLNSNLLELGMFKFY